MSSKIEEPEATESARAVASQAASSVDFRKLELETEKVQAEIAFRRQELELKTQELQIRREELKLGRKISPPLAAWIAAGIGAVATIFVAFLQGQSNIRLEEQRFEASLILDATKEADPEKRAANLQFLISSGLIEDKDAKLSSLVAKPDRIPSFPNGRIYGFGTSKDGVEIDCRCDNEILECRANSRQFQLGEFDHSGTRALAADFSALLRAHQATFGIDAIESVEVYGYADGIPIVEPAGWEEVPLSCREQASGPITNRDLSQIRSCLASEMIRSKVSPKLAERAAIWRVSSRIGSTNSFVSAAAPGGIRGIEVVSRTRGGCG